jgi:hypothetical protein
MRTGLNNHLGHNRIPRQFDDNSGEAIANGVIGKRIPIRITERSCLAKVSQLFSADDRPARIIGLDLEPACLSPASHCVFADTEDLRGAPNPDEIHAVKLSNAANFRLFGRKYLAIRD